ncbi:TRAP transporter small permease [Chloroflexota bacterium]
MNPFKKIVYRMAKVFQWVAMAATIAMMLLVIANIIARLLPGIKPIKGTFEMVELLGIILVSFFFAQAAVEKRHVALTMLFSRLSVKAQLAIRRIIVPISITVLSLIAWSLALRAHSFYLTRQATENMHTVLFPFYIVASVGFASVALVLIADFVDLWRKEARE